MTLSQFLKQGNNLGVLTDIQCYCTVISNLLNEVNDNNDLYNSLSRVSEDLAEIIYNLKNSK